MKPALHDEHRRDHDHWWFAARRAIFARTLDAWLPPASGRNVLDLGPGYGVNAAVLAPRGRWIPLDVALPSLQGCRDAGPALPLCADAAAPPLARGSIDLLCALDVLEHLDDDAAALAAWRPLLAPGGLLLLTVPAFPILWGRQDVLSEHRRRYRAALLRSRLADAGFRVLHLTHFNFLLFSPILLVRLAMRPFLGRTARGGSDLSMRLPLVEGLLRRAMAAERFWVARRSLPFGVSLLVVATPAGPRESAA